MVVVIEEVFKVKEVYGNKEFIVGYRLFLEEVEFLGIIMEIIEEFVNKISYMLIDYIYVLMMDMYVMICEGKYVG